MPFHAFEWKGKAMPQTVPAAIQWSENMRASEAARYLGLSVSKLAKLRMRHNQAVGPRYAKLCGVVIYRRRDLDEWLKSNLVGGANETAE
ncbi:helix-turn-helix domain-containing protein [Aestuariicoccus sp. MJ-SS9]|uniref:helix-turn-helix domain-containing protein n=1 Tax=Aestuariicoccus sp. MJ-SS9 TaxID=3079855 RepID=UPI002913AF59|nr:helix-turn-helix domain-containing protein [Aestuariicoccus sp. MJ-SS9]MDU8914107.1 helix-turn-helix domain-containing protein [Aestuariicoccus sp. MJ-SS9]